MYFLLVRGFLFIVLMVFSEEQKLLILRLFNFSVLSFMDCDFWWRIQNFFLERRS